MLLSRTKVLALYTYNRSSVGDKRVDKAPSGRLRALYERMRAARVGQAVTKGYFVAPTLADLPQFAALRTNPVSRGCSRQLLPDATAHSRPTANRGATGSSADDDHQP